MDITRSQTQFLVEEGSGRRLSRETIRAYEDDVRDMVSFFRARGAEDTKQVTPDLMRAFFADLEARGATTHTQYRRFKRAQRWSQFLLRRRAVPADPMEGVPTYPRTWDLTPTRKVFSVTKQMVRAVTGRELSDLRDRALLEVALETGVAPAKMIEMTESDVDSEACTVVIQDATYRVPRTTIGRIRRYLDAREEALGMVAEGALWTSLSRRSRGSRITRRGVSDILAKWSDAGSAAATPAHRV